MARLRVRGVDSLLDRSVSDSARAGAGVSAAIRRETAAAAYPDTACPVRSRYVYRARIFGESGCRAAPDPQAVCVYATGGDLLGAARYASGSLAIPHMGGLCRDHRSARHRAVRTESPAGAAGGQQLV